MDHPTTNAATADVLTAQVVAVAREIATRTACPMLVAVAEVLKVDVEAATAIVATTLGFEFSPGTAWHQWRADFDVVSLPEARRRHCVYTRDVEGVPHLVIDDPFNEQFYLWAALQHPDVPVSLRHPHAFAQWFD